MTLNLNHNDSKFEDLKIGYHLDGNCTLHSISNTIRSKFRRFEIKIYEILETTREGDVMGSTPNYKSVAWAGKLRRVSGGIFA